MFCAAAAKASTPVQTPAQSPSSSKPDLTEGEVAVDIEGETKAEAALDVSLCDSSGGCWEGGEHQNFFHFLCVCENLCIIF